MVCSREAYLSMGLEHTKKDRIATLKEVLEKQRLLTSHARALVNIFKVGINHGDGNQNRVWDNSSSQAGSIPVLYLMPKMHKPIQSNGLPKT